MPHAQLFIKKIGYYFYYERKEDEEWQKQWPPRSHEIIIERRARDVRAEQDLAGARSASIVPSVI